MLDSDDDIVILDEIGPEIKSKKWKWKAPNPMVPIQEGAVEEILKNVRARLQMENPVLPVDEKNGSAGFTTATKGRKSKSSVVKSQSNHSLPGPSGQSFKADLQKTPPKHPSLEAPLSLTPEQILELTENCLDSDNEPEMTPVKPIPSDQCQRDPAKPTPKRALNFNSFKASSSIHNRPSKYFGAGISSASIGDILSQGNEEARSPSKSPSPKKRRLSKNSPIRLLPSHRNLGKSPKKSPPKQNLLKYQSPDKARSNPSGALDMNQENMSPISDGPYYSEAFCYIIKKVSCNPEYKHLFLESELQKLQIVNDAKKEFQLYVRLMNRKDKWNRCQDICYNDIASDLTPLFDFLEKEDLVLCDMAEATLDTLLLLLKVEELKAVCTQFKVKKSGTKPEMVQSLLLMHKTQPTLAGTSPMVKCVTGLLGRCVRLKVCWRLVFRRCILLFSMFHSDEDLDKLSSEQALLFLQVKLGKMVFPVKDSQIIANAKVFSSRDQLIRFEEARELIQEMNIAIEAKNYEVLEELTSKCMMKFSSLLKLLSETSHVSQLPVFLQKFCAGSTYVHGLTRSVDSLKQKQIQNYKLALKVLNILLGQQTYGVHKRGKWALMKSKLLHVNVKDIVEASKALCEILQCKSSLSNVDRMHLQERAEKVFKLKKNGLPQVYKDQLAKVMDPPRLPPEAVEICAKAFSNFKPGLKKVFVKESRDMKEYMSVEEIVISHYKSLGFMYGVHDEGSTISSLCLLSLWNVIYDVHVPSVFQSPYQYKPLDWGSKEFYESRREKIEICLGNLLHRDAKSVATELCNMKDKVGGTTSMVNWDRLESINIFTFLECISIPVFVAVGRRLVENWKSHRSGFPDLVIWSPPQKKCLFVEVKSSNDTLSTVQCMWLEFLTEHNAKAIVAHVRETGSKVVRSVSY